MSGTGFVYKYFLVCQTLIFLYLKCVSLCRTSSFLMPDIWFPYVRHQRSYVEMLVFLYRMMVILMLENGYSYVGEWQLYPRRCFNIDSNIRTLQPHLSTFERHPCVRSVRRCSKVLPGSKRRRVVDPAATSSWAAAISSGKTTEITTPCGGCAGAAASADPATAAATAGASVRRCLCGTPNCARSARRAASASAAC
jgi:hypothetical protein